VRWAIGEHLADPTRICSYGASFGAYAAMMVAVREPGMFRCAAGQAGIYDLKMMYDKGDIRESEYGRNYLQRVIGSDPVELAANSPVNLAEKIRIPVFLAHGERDERAPFAQAKAMRAALEKSGNTPEWMAVPREGHGFYKDENNVVFYRRLEAFLARNLLSGNAAAGSTAGDAKTP
jgi:dipeptidyl aminopeptidase/acylaminoacyl peptidase